jgi:hypothetical protein
MNRRDLETLLLTLESTPALFARAADGLTSVEATFRAEGSGFSFVENVWHLADLEREGYGARIRRILSEEEPTLANFDGDRVARERVYQQRSLAEGLAAFAHARQRNVERLRAVQPSDWNRTGVQEGVGRIRLEDVPRMMAEHDRSHTEEVRDLLARIRGAAVGERPRPVSAVA